MESLQDLIVCEDCDAVYRRVPIYAHETARCPRCDGELDRNVGNRIRHILPLTVAAIVTYLIANLFPIVEIELQGITSQTTLFGAVVMLTRENMSLVAALVFATTMLFPLLQMLILFYLLAPIREQESRPGMRPGFAPLLRFLQDVRPWGMIEVFLLGVLVAVVKLSNMAKVIPGVALWAFGALTILLAAVLSLSPRYFWQLTEMPGAGTGRTSGPDADPDGDLVLGRDTDAA